MPDSLALRVVKLPWVFTQHGPADTSDFTRLARERGYDLDLETLRALNKGRLLAPFVALRSRRHSSPSTTEFDSEPRSATSRLAQLRHARGNGQLADPGADKTVRLVFGKPSVADGRWWNGLLYSYWQLLTLPVIDGLIRQKKARWRDEKRFVTIPKPGPAFVEGLVRYERIVAVATAIEARYLPVLEPEWVRLSGATAEEWEQYRAEFDPVAMRDLLDISPGQLRDDAETLLSCAHRLDTFGPDWSAWFGGHLLIHGSG